MSDQIVVVPYDPDWIHQFHRLALPIRQALGATAVRIDHIGSTAIPTIAAKPIIDILISVDTFTPFEPILYPLEQIGYRWQPDNPDQSKRYFREPIGEPRIHIHVHKIGTWWQQFPLLFRDYLRENTEDAHQYEILKLALAQQFRDDRVSYTNGKSDLIWAIMRRASLWVQTTGWEAPISDL